MVCLGEDVQSLGPIVTHPSDPKTGVKPYERDLVSNLSSVGFVSFVELRIRSRDVSCLNVPVFVLCEMYIALYKIRRIIDYVVFKHDYVVCIYLDETRKMYNISSFRVL